MIYDKRDAERVSQDELAYSIDDVERVRRAIYEVLVERGALVPGIAANINLVPSDRLRQTVADRLGEPLDPRLFIEAVYSL